MQRESCVIDEKAKGCLVVLPLREACIPVSDEAIPDGFFPDQQDRVTTMAPLHLLTSHGEVVLPDRAELPVSVCALRTPLLLVGIVAL